MRAIAALVALSLVFVTWVPSTAGAQMLDWDGVSAETTVEVLTEDEDGALRVTTVWLLVQNDEGYVRTGGSTWGNNVVRTEELTLRVGEKEYPMSVVFEGDDTRREEIKQGFRDKYGWFDGFIGWVRGSHPKHMRLVAR